VINVGHVSSHILITLKHTYPFRFWLCVELHGSTVWVHFHSSDPAYNRADCWGPLFYAASPIRGVTGELVLSCFSEPFTPLTLVKVQKDPAELCSVMSP
jgi:hypothetical protein